MGVPDPAGAGAELSAARQAQVGPAAADHRAGQHERPRTHAALLLEHRAQPRRHAVPDADDASAASTWAREFRYLEPTTTATLRANYMPERPAARPRPLGLSRRSTTAVRSAAGAGRRPACSLNLNRVSDDNYWRDFSRNTRLAHAAPAGQRRHRCPGAAATCRVRRAHAEVADAAGRRPRPSCRRTTGAAALGALRAQQPGRRAGALASRPTTRASSRTRVLTGQPNAQRSYALAQLSRPWQAPGWFVMPKLQLHAHALPVRRAAGQRRDARANRTRAHLQPGQRPGVRARRQLLRPRLPADAGAARLLRLHAVPRPEPAAELRLGAATTSTSRPSTPRTRSAATTASPTTTC